jgi:hypothetical protein
MITSKQLCNLADGYNSKYKNKLKEVEKFIIETAKRGEYQIEMDVGTEVEPSYIYRELVKYSIGSVNIDGRIITINWREENL